MIFVSLIENARLNVSSVAAKSSKLAIACVLWISLYFLQIPPINLYYTVASLLACGCVCQM